MSITNNYTSGYEDLITDSANLVGGFFGGIVVFLGIFMIVGLAITVLIVISLFKIFKKNGKPGWYSLIPFLNMWTLFEIAGNKGWLSLIPLANVIFMYISNYKLAIKMGKSTGIAVVVTLFPVVGYPILAFSKTVVNEDATVVNNDTQNIVTSVVSEEVNAQEVNNTFTNNETMFSNNINSINQPINNNQNVVSQEQVNTSSVNTYQDVNNINTTQDINGGNVQSQDINNINNSNLY